MSLATIRLSAIRAETLWVLSLTTLSAVAVAASLLCLCLGSPWVAIRISCGTALAVACAVFCA